MSTKINALFSIADHPTPKINRGGQAYTLESRDYKNAQCVMTYRKQGHPRNSNEGQSWEESEVNDTLNIFDNSENRTPTLILENQPTDSRIKILKDVVQTLTGRMGTGGGNTPMVMQNSEPIYLESNEDKASIKTDGISNSLTASMGEGSGHIPMITESPEEKSPYENMIVRRLTPLECVRLQGYPDNWLDIGEWTDSNGKLHKDSDAPKYKAAGNSIALPFWGWLAEKIAKQLRKDGTENPTMASLFDGIGGFPLVFQRVDVKPVWASEIEEYPMAVTKKHFGED